MAPVPGEMAVVTRTKSARNKRDGRHGHCSVAMAEGVDRDVDLHCGEGGPRRDEVGDRDRVLAGGEPLVEKQQRVAFWVWWHKTRSATRRSP
jgi:hypothetical protein